MNKVLFIGPIVMGLAVIGIMLIATAQWKGRVVVLPGHRFFVGIAILTTDVGIIMGSILYGIIN